jgi:hypothetical protein
MFPQAATNTTFKSLLVSLSLFSQKQAREDARKGKRAIEDDQRFLSTTATLPRILYINARRNKIYINV